MSNVCLFNTLDAGIWGYPYLQIPPKKTQLSFASFDIALFCIPERL